MNKKANVVVIEHSTRWNEEKCDYLHCCTGVKEPSHIEWLRQAILCAGVRQSIRKRLEKTESVW